MSAQYPAEALGSAIGVLIYSSVSLICCILSLWLVSVHAERTSCEFYCSRNLPSQ